MKGKLKKEGKQFQLEFYAEKISGWNESNVNIYNKNRDLEKKVKQIKNVIALMNYIPNFLIHPFQNKYIKLFDILEKILKRVEKNHNILGNIKLEFYKILLTMEDELSKIECSRIKQQKKLLLSEYWSYKKILDYQIKENSKFMFELKDSIKSINNKKYIKSSAAYKV